jgi:hypothetical protein
MTTTDFFLTEIKIFLRETEGLTELKPETFENATNLVAGSLMTFEGLTQRQAVEVLLKTAFDVAARRSGFYCC